MNYFKNISFSIASLVKGLRVTWDHFLKARTSRDPVPVYEENYFDKKEGVVTLQYPFESIPVPDNGRYQLHNEIDDCIVCDKCAKVCPVNCIDIEPVRAVEEIGKTSDGTPRRIYAAKFDIDMGKCCFCGLCTTVCPTECLTMTKEYDFSVFDITEHNFEFGNMSEDEVDLRRKELEEHNAKKVAAKTKQTDDAVSSVSKKPSFKPKVKGSVAGSETTGSKPAFKPKVKPLAKKPTNSDEADKPVTKDGATEEITQKASKPKFKPKVKPAVKKSANPDEADQPISQDRAIEEDSKKASRPVFKPKIKPKASNKGKDGGEVTSQEKPEVSKGANDSKTEDGGKPKTARFRPKIKPKK